MLASNAALARKMKSLEKKYDEQFKVVFDAIRQLMVPPEKKKMKSPDLSKAIGQCLFYLEKMDDYKLNLEKEHNSETHIQGRSATKAEATSSGVL